MIPCLSSLKDNEIIKLIEFNILENKEGKTSEYLHSLINIGTLPTYLKIGANLYQIYFSSGNFYPIIYKVYAWKYIPIRKPIDYYVFNKVNNEIKVKQFYANLNKYRKLN
jgi:type III secretory pathway component EscT